MFPTFRISGLDVAAINLSRACDLINAFARSGRAEYVTVTGAHGIVESVYDSRVLEAHRSASMSVPDGMPLVWLGHLLGYREMRRVYGPDLMAAVFSRPDLRMLRHFFYGSSPSTIATLRDVLTVRFGDFNFVGEYCPPIRPAGFVEDPEIISQIGNLRPDIIWVSLSTPKQELWLNAHMPEIGSGVGIGAGAAFELVAGITRQAPRWIQQSGFEWLFRLAMEPRRLFRRYLFVVPVFFCVFLIALMKRGGTRR